MIMEQRKDMEGKVEKALESLDGLKRAEPQPWFFTRVNSRLMREQRTAWEYIGGLLSRPTVAIAGLCLVLMMNVYFLWQQPQAKATPSMAGQIEAASESESMIASSSSFEFENLAQ